MKRMLQLLTKEGRLLKKSIIDDNKQYAELASLFKMFSDETRLKIMFALAEKNIAYKN